MFVVIPYSSLKLPVLSISSVSAGAFRPLYPERFMTYAAFLSQKVLTVLRRLGEGIFRTFIWKISIPRDIELLELADDRGLFLLWPAPAIEMPIS